MTLPFPPSGLSDAYLEQFAHGKLIDAGRDVRGFTTVARSPGAPGEDWVSRILNRADVGQEQDVEHFAGADVAFVLENLVLVGRMRRSPRPYERGYFIQQHYLVLSRSAFATLGNNYAYLWALLPDEIPLRARDEVLPALILPTRAPRAEKQRCETVYQSYEQPLLRALQLALDEQPFVIFPGALPPEQSQAFLETLTLLLPTACRGQLACAVNVVNARRCKAQVKLMAASGMGTEGHTVIRLETLHPTTVPLSQTGRLNGSVYLDTAQQYCKLFGLGEWLNAMEMNQLPDNFPWATQLGTLMRQTYGPAILLKSLPNLTRPLPPDSVTTAISLLDASTANLTPEQRSILLAVVVGGVIDGVLPNVDEAQRIAQDLEHASVPMLWEKLLEAFGDRLNPRGLQVLSKWREATPQLWDRQDFQQRLLFPVLLQELRTAGELPEKALERLSKWAVGRINDRNLIPNVKTGQQQLLQQALTSTAAPANYRPEALLLTWMAMASDAKMALDVARDVPALSELLWNYPYKYIISGLQNSPPETVQREVGPSGGDLDQQSDFFLAVALMGERLGLRALRVPAILNGIAQRSAHLDPERLNRLLARLEADLQNHTRETQAAIAGLMVSAGHAWRNRFRRLLELDWRRLDLLIVWLEQSSILTSSHSEAIKLVMETFQKPVGPGGMQPEDRVQLLKRAFEQWTRLAYGTPRVVTELTGLLLHTVLIGDLKMNGEAGLGQRIVGKVSGREPVRQTLEGIRFVRRALFPNTDDPHRVSKVRDYNVQLTWAFEQAYSSMDAKMRVKLIDGLLKDRDLKEDGDLLSNVNFGHRGKEIFTDYAAALTQILKAQEDLASLMVEMSSFTSRPGQALFLDPYQRSQMAQQGQQVSKALEQLRQQLQGINEWLR